MKFELLPNEIFIEIFEYLSTYDIFYSFNRLNNHFNQIIGSIPLHLKFTNIQKPLFDKFCQLLLSNPEFKNQIYTLELSNKETPDQIKTFISFFSFHDFHYLHSLTLIQISDNLFQHIKFILPQLHSFHLIDSNDIYLTNSLISHLQILTIPTLSSIDKLSSSSSITNLTISGCSLDQLFSYVFKYVPMLNHLTIEYFSNYYSWEKNSFDNHEYKAIHLKELNIFNSEYKFQDIQNLLKSTPNLINLKICGTCDLDMIDGNQWENFIRSSLVYLTKFQFIFKYIFKTSIDHIYDKLNQFQNNFWIKQHQWYSEYSLSTSSVIIYTIPYILNYYKLEVDSKKYSNQFLNTFDNVKHLILYHKVNRESYEYYFTNIKSLIIIPPENNSSLLFNMEIFRSLKLMINLSNIEHLGISFNFQIENSRVLLEILQSLPKLSSLMINFRNFIRFTSNKELCEYLNKTIKKLDIYKYYSLTFKYYYEKTDLCQIFSNIEQFKCNIDEIHDLLYLLKHLPKLTKLNAYFRKIKDYDRFRCWFKDQTKKLNLPFDIKCIDTYESEVSVWINREI
ncbi:unnamed protein product [Adineta steineri]|uniref:F-box domain-containing protein n=1 Tax=Adineta steineri TaxID=433720 RepID=A0A814K1D2_9BILA|nr:unnamed protein product [Adineta steineri]CAF1044875.1 unnamed protein product [Adineta steineri]